MAWFVAGTIGFVELLRFVQNRLAALQGRWQQAALFGFGTALLIGGLSLLPGGMDLKELMLMTPFVVLLAGVEGGVLGGAAIAVAVPGYAVLTLATAGIAAVLAYYRRSPLWALVPAWGWIAGQKVLQAFLRGRGLDPVADGAISLLGAVAFGLYVREVDHRRAELFRARAQAATDPLTGLLNRNGLARHLGRVGAASVIAIDLDDFKPINELYGHTTGDLVLQEAARRLQSAMRSVDALARVGGDEFVAAVSEVTADGAVEITERMRRSLEQDDVVLPSGHIQLHASFGIATGEISELLDHADIALLKAKAEGKARTCVYGQGSNHDSHEEQLLRVTRFARDLLFGLSEGVAILGPTRRIVAVSRGFEALSGLPAAEVVGQKPHAQIGTDFTDFEHQTEIVTSIARYGVWRGELVNRRPSGEIWWADWSMRNLEVRGRRLGYLGIVRDVTGAHRHNAQLLAEAVGILSEKHDPSIGDHLRRTGRYMEILAGAFQERAGRSALPLNPEEYLIAATMHDIGKIALPAEILAKPGALTPEERRIVNRHPEHGYEYLARLCSRWCTGPGSDYTRMLLRCGMEIALFHHERVDGSGYPHGARGDQIPISARLFSVVDVYDALQSARPYKQPWREEEAFEYLVENAGSQFDPTVVTLLGDIRRQGNWLSVRAGDAD
ncbi:MAG: diguanylate cyclase [Thermaerobacter sp.]|nr:diguanylate cyclase [Thermaerobacter sp.]